MAETIIFPGEGVVAIVGDLTLVNGRITGPDGTEQELAVALPIGDAETTKKSITALGGRFKKLGCMAVSIGQPPEAA